MWELIVDSAVGIYKGDFVAVSTVVSDNISAFDFVLVGILVDDKISALDFVLVGILVDDKILEVDFGLVGILDEGTGDVGTSCNCIVKQ